jgi:Putative auto-transporter adhesin, head GIN domain
MHNSCAKSFSFSLACVVAPILLLISADSFAAEQVRKLPAFSSISSDGVFNLKVDVGPTQEVKISSEEINLDQVTTEVVNNELVLSFKNKAKKFKSEEGITVVVSVPSLSKLRIKGVGPTEVKHIKASDFELNYEGVGVVKMEGKVNNLILNAKGVGSVDAKALKSQIANVSLNGVGEVSVYASDTLNANVSGIGSMIYYGKPAHVNKTANGLGKIVQGN